MTMSMINGGQAGVQRQQSLVSRHSQRGPEAAPSRSKRNVLATPLGLQSLPDPMKVRPKAQL